MSCTTNKPTLTPEQWDAKLAACEAYFTAFNLRSRSPALHTEAAYGPRPQPQPCVEFRFLGSQRRITFNVASGRYESREKQGLLMGDGNFIVMTQTYHDAFDSNRPLRKALLRLDPNSGLDAKEAAVDESTGRCLLAHSAAVAAEERLAKAELEHQAASIQHQKLMVELETLIQNGPQ